MMNTNTTLACRCCKRNLSDINKKHWRNSPEGKCCNTCYNKYFAAEKICHVCQRHRRDVATRSILKKVLLPSNATQCCMSCYERLRATRATCTSCKRHRILNDDKLCDKCATGQQAHCRRCGVDIPLGRGNHCMTCEKKLGFERCIPTNIAKIHNIELQTLYQEFCEYLLKEHDNVHSTKEFNKYVEFFIICDKKWGYLPDYDQLVTHFKTEGLRTYLRLLRWLEESAYIITNQKTKNSVSEQERIRVLLSKFSPTPTLIHDYHEELSMQVRINKIQFKTMRLALQPVVDLYLLHKLNSDDIPNKCDFDNYLLKKPGQYNNLVKFISYIKRDINPDLIVNRPDKEGLDEERHRKLLRERTQHEKDMIKIINNPIRPQTKELNLIWIRHAMMVFHSQKISIKSARTFELIGEDSEAGLNLYRFNKKEYWLPKVP